MLGTSFNPMNEYLFYTIEGYTSPPLETKAVENCQLLGRAKGRNQTEARQYLLDENPWIDEAGFDIQSAIAQQIIAEKQKETLLRPEKRKVQSSKTKSTELTSQNNKTKSTKEGRKISTPPFLHHIEDTIDMIN